jgi:hypothetical protein
MCSVHIVPMPAHAAVGTERPTMPHSVRVGVRGSVGMVRAQTPRCARSFRVSSDVEGVPLQPAPHGACRRLQVADREDLDRVEPALRRLMHRPPSVSPRLPLLSCADAWPVERPQLPVSASGPLDSTFHRSAVPCSTSWALAVADSGSPSRSRIAARQNVSPQTAIAVGSPQ